MLAGAPTVMSTVVWVAEVLAGPQWLMDFVAVGGLCHSVKDQVLIYTSEWREAIVCKSLAQEN